MQEHKDQILDVQTSQQHCNYLYIIDYLYHHRNDQGSQLHRSLSIYLDNMQDQGIVLNTIELENADNMSLDSTKRIWGPTNYGYKHRNQGFLGIFLRKALLSYQHTPNYISRHKHLQNYQGKKEFKWGIHKHISLLLSMQSDHQNIRVHPHIYE